jgi:NAD+ diphosphatase
MARRNRFSWAGLDRVAHLRQDEGWLAEQRRAASSRLVPVWRSRSLVREGDTPHGVFPLLADAIELLATCEPLVLLGLERDTAYFAADVSHLDDPPGPSGEKATFVDLRQVGGRLDERDSSLLAYARAMATWHTRHRFCGACGSPTEGRQAGHLRVCRDDACASQHFPRTDPAVIMLVHDGERALLGRQASWPAGVYSTLAGFVEPGEGLEDAVAREVLEETGVRVTDVHYHSSQPWPFPSSLMLGFEAHAETGEVDLAVSELEDAHWFDADELRELEARREVRLPPRLSIARRLIEDWLASP